MVAHSFYNTSVARAYGEERIPTPKLYTRFWLSVDDLFATFKAPFLDLPERSFASCFGSN
jgi:hypothetical protein